jgi:hypothetical protein
LFFLRRYARSARGRRLAATHREQWHSLPTPAFGLPPLPAQPSGVIAPALLYRNGARPAPSAPRVSFHLCRFCPSWLFFTPPALSGVRSSSVSPCAFRPISFFPPLVWLAETLRSLGGLCVLKLKYKGKSFR